MNEFVFIGGIAIVFFLIWLNSLKPKKEKPHAREETGEAQCTACGQKVRLYFGRKAKHDIICNSCFVDSIR